MVFGFNLDPLGLTHHHSRPPRNGTKHHTIGEALGKVGSTLRSNVIHNAQRLGKKGSKSAEK